MTVSDFFDKIERPSSIAAYCWGLGWVPVLMSLVYLCYINENDAAMILCIIYALPLALYAAFILICMGIFGLIEALNDKE